MARLTRNDRAVAHRLGPRELDDVEDGMPNPGAEFNTQFKAESSADDGYLDGDDAYGDGLGDGPLRFDAPVAHVESTSSEYAAPRLSRWRVLRFPFVVTAVAIALLITTWTAWTLVLGGVADVAAALVAREDDGQTRVSVSIGLVALALSSFIATWWKHSHPRRPVRLADGRGTIAVDAIAGQLRAAIIDLPEVRSAEVAVENRGGGQVRVRAWLAVTAEARIDDALDGVDAAADWLVHHRLGLMLSEPPLAEVRYDELDLRAARAPMGSGAAELPNGERAG